MDENVEMTARTSLRIVQNMRAVGLELGHDGGEIGNLEGYMMEPFAVLGDELCDHRFGPGGLDQLDTRAACRQHRNLHLFLFHGLAEDDRKAKLLLVEFQRLFKGAHRDSQMINLESV